uniref:Uncharacterized protein n=1 Tax=Ditylum brightwellii TaxID=49249 RepID=A0A7S4QSZ7_9STRA
MQEKKIMLLHTRESEKWQSPSSKRANKSTQNKSVVKIGHCTESTAVISWDGPTELYTFIENGQWDASMARLQKAPLEARQYMVRTFNDEITMFRLPIHEACNHNPSVDIIVALTEAYRDGVEKEDLNGRLPLHRACISGASLDVVLNLVHAYPEGLNAKDKWGKTPRDCLKDGQNVDSDLVAVLERTPTYYAARIAEDKLMSTLNKEFMSKIDSITEKVKNEKNTTDLIISSLSKMKSHLN